jgi:hypothetical protein
MSFCASCALVCLSAATEWIVPATAGQIKILNRGATVARVRMQVAAESLEVTMRAGETVSLPDDLWRRVTQTTENKRKIVQDVEGRDGNSISRKILATVVSNIGGTCQGLTVALDASRLEKERNNSCSATWMPETSSGTGPGAATLLEIRVPAPAGSGAGFGAGKGSITTEVDYVAP